MHRTGGIIIFLELAHTLLDRAAAAAFPSTLRFFCRGVQASVGRGLHWCQRAWEGVALASEELMGIALASGLELTSVLGLELSLGVRGAGAKLVHGRVEVEASG